MIGKQHALENVYNYGSFILCYRPYNIVWPWEVRDLITGRTKEVGIDYNDVRVREEIVEMMRRTHLHYEKQKSKYREDWWNSKEW